MSKEQSINYWLFQANSSDFRLKEALKEEAIESFAVKAHKKKIKKGDKVILWQTGNQSGCYALCTVVSDVENSVLAKDEQSYYLETPKNEPRVKIKIDFNLWNRPIIKSLLPNNKTFQSFYGGLPGTNYKATKEQYEGIKSLVGVQNILEEPRENYSPIIANEHPLNIVLYGPPGTGKTYSTINYALSIIENRSLEELALEDRGELKKRFHEYGEEGLIYFVSFHQAFSYEDFVEGIKPHTEERKVFYDIENGVFKHICMEAKRNLVETFIGTMPNTEVKVDFNQLYTAFLNYLKSDNFDSFTSINKRRILMHRVARNGNISVRHENSFTLYTIYKSRLRKIYKKIPLPEVVENIEKELTPLVDGVNTAAYWSIFMELKKFEQQFVDQLMVEKEALDVHDEEIETFSLNAFSDAIVEQSRKFVLIIDEINRGNIASIFGDLISLIEPNKREGKKESLYLVLPYSKTLFAVPPNLYIIGTMNTADRSVEAIDVALRRRFTFIEKAPNASIIKNEARQPVTAGIDLEKLLIAINTRIEILLDKDYRLGHSYFMKITTLDDLKHIFATKIIPLLQEYFFGDFGKIGLVLGSDFIEELNFGGTNVFANFNHEYINELADKKVYRISDLEKLTAAAFIRIYDKEYE